VGGLAADRARRWLVAAASGCTLKLVATTLLALATAAIFTWPAPVAGNDLLVGRGFDASGMLWMAWYAGEHLGESGLTSTVTGHPAGETLHGTDAWLHLLAAWLLPLASARAQHLIAWLGCAATFVAGERMAARGFGARWPWSLAAGAAFACNGVAFGALVAGRHYHLFQAGLPLFAWAWVWVLEGRRTGLAAGFAWVLCLASSAYTALLATLMGGWLWLFHPGRRRTLSQQVLAGVPAGLAALAFVSVFSTGEREVVTAGAPALEHVSRSVTLSSLLGWNPAHGETALFSGAALGFAAFGLALAGVRLLPRRQWLPLLSGGLVATLLAFGPQAVALPLASEPVSTPWAWLAEVWPASGELRFHARFQLVAHLAFGTLAALVLSASRAGWLRGVLLAGVFVDALFWGRPLDAAVTVAAPGNPVYATIERGPVLDVLPNASSPLDRGVLNAVHHACASQALHGQVVVDPCLLPSTRGTTGAALRRRLLPALVGGEVGRARRGLREAGVSTVVAHLDLFTSADAAGIERTLLQVGRNPRSGVGGGERLLVVDVGAP